MIKRLTFVLVVLVASTALAADPPELTAPVNDFAHVVDAKSAEGIERLSRALKNATGDVVVVATVPTIEGYGDIREYATKMFENHGKGIGEKGKNNGLLIVLAINEHRVRIEVGYGLEEFVTDRFAGETSRQYMVPEFRSGGYGQGLLVGTARVVGRIAKGRGVKLEDVQVPDDGEGTTANFPVLIPVLIFIAILIISRIGGGPGAGMLLWGLGPWSRWSSGVGSFGGGRGGGFGGGGFGGGFGGFGGGGSGGGGGGAGW